MEEKFKLPTETVELPSKGKVYPKESPLSKGEVEIKYMTAKEEDILTNQNYITKGTVIDKLLESLLVDKTIKYGDLLIGDKNALMVAARILAYGKDYEINYGGEPYNVDLSEVDSKPIDKIIEKCTKNEFEFQCTNSDNVLTFKLLTHDDETSIEKEVQGLKKINKESSPEVTTRFKYMITSVNGLSDKKDIREFVDNYFLSKDSRALREYYRNIAPDVDLTFDYETPGGNTIEKIPIPIGVNFFWPDAGV